MHFETLETRQMMTTLTTDPGDTAFAAYGMGTLTATAKSFDQKVSATDTNDYYRFTLPAAKTVNLKLTNLTADADLELRDATGSTVIARSENYNTQSEAVTRSLAAGTYFVRVYRFTGSPSYRLSASATSASNNNNNSSQLQFGNYVGTATTTIDYMNLLNNTVASRQTVSIGTTVRIGAPLQSTSYITPNQPVTTRENNPFNLYVAPTNPSQAGSAGAFWLTSASVYMAQSISQRTTFSWWSLQRTSTGFSGLLTNSGGSMAMNGQQFWSHATLIPGRPDMGTYLAPFSMYDAKYGAQYQARLTATVSGNQLRIRVTGWANTLGSNLVRFSTDVVVARQG